jgi:hypothetical protein
LHRLTSAAMVDLLLDLYKLTMKAALIPLWLNELLGGLLVFVSANLINVN